MPILNMIAQSGGGGNIGEPLNLTVTTSGLDATIKWEDNEIGTIPPTTFQKSELVRKIGSAPTSPSDGTLVVTETVKDTYKVSGYVDSGLTDGTTYYYRVFSYSDLGGISYCDAVSVTPSPGWQPGVDTVLYYDFEHTSGTAETDLAGNYNGTYQNGTPTIGTLASGKKYFDTQGTNCLNTNSTLSTLDYNNATVCIWFNMVNSSTYFGQERWAVQGGTIFCETYLGNTSVCLGPDSNTVSTPTSLAVWYNIVIVNDGVNTTLYKNGQQVAQTSMNSSTGDKYFHVGGAAGYSIPSPQTTPNIGNALFGSVIIENKSRTAQDVSDYYDQTKAKYGIS